MKPSAPSRPPGTSFPIPRSRRSRRACGASGSSVENCSSVRRSSSLLLGGSNASGARRSERDSPASIPATRCHARRWCRARPPVPVPEDGIELRVQRSRVGMIDHDLPRQIGLQRPRAYLRVQERNRVAKRGGFIAAPPCPRGESPKQERRPPRLIHQVGQSETHRDCRRSSRSEVGPSKLMLPPFTSIIQQAVIGMRQHKVRLPLARLSSLSRHEPGDAVEGDKVIRRVVTQPREQPLLRPRSRCSATRGRESSAP